MAILLRRTPLAFAVIVALIYAVAIGIAHMPAPAHPSVLAAAVLIDLTVVVPFCYWLLFLDRGTTLLRLMPVFLLSLAGAAVVLPADFGWVVQYLRVLAVPAELALVGYLLWRMRGYYRGLQAQGTEDVLERLHESFTAVLQRPRLAAVLAYETAVLHYALGCWRQRPDPGDTTRFAYHRNGGYGAIVGVLMMVCAIEVFVVHLAVTRWSPTAAWVLTILGVYTMVWLVADYHAARLRPLVVGDDALWVRLGLRWRLRIPYDCIVRAHPRGKEELSRRTPGYLHAALLVEPHIVVELREPMQAAGPYGIGKQVTRVGIAVDHNAGLESALRARGVSMSALAS
jgi:hypothetical protein